MINIIKTAIITIIISFASGLLLDYYRNLGPRILCNVRKGKPTEKNSKENSAYIITVKNPSSRTIHELTINIQSSQTNLKSTGARITKGLKFESSIKGSILEVYIPFISKGDEFSVTIYEENQYSVNNKPVIVIRSPENFKEIDSSEQRGILSLLRNIPKNAKEIFLKEMEKIESIGSNKKDNRTTDKSKNTNAERSINKKNEDLLPENSKLSKHKKTVIIIASIILVMIVGVFTKVYSKGTSTNKSTPTVKTVVPKQSTGTTGTSGTNGTTETPSTKASTGGTTETPSTKASTGGTTETPSTTGGTTTGN
ncbi:hypothetical protein KPL38_12675 [Clostridium psychrophilum]|nr:hypothetical protein [Clostridium psychrophilum]